MIRVARKIFLLFFLRSPRKKYLTGYYIFGWNPVINCDTLHNNAS